MDKRNVAEVAAKEIAKIVREKYGGRHSVRPYDIHRPSNSEWWVVPSSDWPAYVHSKFFFLAIDETSIDTGIYIEKGFSPEIGRSAKRFQINPKWTWNKLVAHASQGGIDRLLGENESIKPVLEVHVSTTRESDVESDDEVREKYRFSYHAGRRAGKLVCCDPKKPRLMEGLESHNSVKALIQTCTASGYYWVDLYVGTEYDMGKTSPDSIWKYWLSKLLFFMNDCSETLDIQALERILNKGFGP